MFDFEKLTVYMKAKEFNTTIRSKVLKGIALDPPTRNQLIRSSLSIMLNIAEGSGRLTKPDKRRFYVMARGSLFESIAILHSIQDEIESESIGASLYNLGEEISKMLYVMIKQHSN